MPSKKLKPMPRHPAPKPIKKPLIKHSPKRIVFACPMGMESSKTARHEFEQQMKGEKIKNI